MRLGQTIVILFWYTLQIASYFLLSRCLQSSDHLRLSLVLDCCLDNFGLWQRLAIRARSWAASWPDPSTDRSAGGRPPGRPCWAGEPAGRRCTPWLPSRWWTPPPTSASSRHMLDLSSLQQKLLRQGWGWTSGEGSRRAARSQPPWPTSWSCWLSSPPWTQLWSWRLPRIGTQKIRTFQKKKSKK